MFKKWQAIQYEGVWFVFRDGALLDPWAEKFAIRGGRFAAERLAELLNARL